MGGRNPKINDGLKRELRIQKLNKGNGSTRYKMKEWENFRREFAENSPMIHRL